MQQIIATGKSIIYSTKFHKVPQYRIITVRSSWYSSKFHIIQQFVYNNVYIKFKTVYYTILSSLRNQFFENNFCPIEEVHRIGNDLHSKNIYKFYGDRAFCFLGRGFSIF